MAQRIERCRGRLSLIQLVSKNRLQHGAQTSDVRISCEMDTAGYLR